MSLPQEQLSDFTAQPWCRVLLASPDLIEQQTLSRQSPQPNTNHSHSFFSGTLATANGIRAVLSFEEQSTGDLIMLFSLGTGLNGPEGIVHGGCVMTLLDAVAALCARRSTGCPVITTEQTTRFQRKIVGPCVVLARARVTQKSRKLVVTEARLEDGADSIYATATATFSTRTAKL